MLKIGLLVFMSMFMITGCTNYEEQPEVIPTVDEPATTTTVVSSQENGTAYEMIEQRSIIFVEDTNGLDDGVLRLIYSMDDHGQPFFKSDSVSHGMIAANDVVLLQINAQWAERGGTNTDLIARVVEAILSHPDGFTGEIIIADNGQAQFGSEGRGGNLDWSQPNSACRQQSTLDVVRNFQADGYRVAGILWDEFTTVRVAEFNDGDYADGCAPRMRGQAA